MDPISDHSRATADRLAPQRSTAPIVTLDQVGHRFGDTEALRSLSFSVPAGRITVLLGPNGAGKTTAIRAITGALVPTSGTVRTFDLDPDVDGHLVRPRCGVVAAKPALYDRLSGRDNMIYSAQLYGMQGDLEGPVDAAAERFGIADVGLARWQIRLFRQPHPQFHRDFRGGRGRYCDQTRNNADRGRTSPQPDHRSYGQVPLFA